MPLALIEFFQVFTSLWCSTPQGLTIAVKVSNFSLHASKVDACLIKGHPISSILKIKIIKHLSSLQSPCIWSKSEIMAVFDLFNSDFPISTVSSGRCQRFKSLLIQFIKGKGFLVCGVGVSAHTQNSQKLFAESEANGLGYEAARENLSPNFKKTVQ